MSGWQPQTPPTLFHITHWKAGSTWVDRILRRCTPNRIILPRPSRAQFLEAPIEEGRVYPRVYVTREEFEGVRLPKRWRRFVVIRDLRDTLVSAYFSVKVSHPVAEFPDLAQDRAMLQQMNVDDGLASMLDHFMVTKSADIQESWLKAGESVIHYESLLEGDVGILERVLIDECDLPVASGRVRWAVAGARFEQITGGRARGQEDVAVHQRKGIAGDWRNYFSDSLKDRFKSKWGELLIRAGYERDTAW